MKGTTKPKQPFVASRRRLLLLGIFVLVLYVLIPRIGDFKTSLDALAAAKPSWLAVCAGGLLASYLFAAATYILLAKKKLRYAPTLLVEIASMFTNRLLPAGVGAIGINYAYLRRNKHSPSEAAGVAATNNLVGFAGHSVLLLVVIAVGRGHLVPVHLPSRTEVLTAGCIVLLIGLVAYMLVRSRRHRTGNFLRAALADIAAYRKRPGRLLLALGSSVILTGCYAVMLFAAAHAVGIDLPIDKVFIVLSLGVAGATATPTPGGLGGAEASIVGGFALYGISSGHALAAALLYRLFTYWLALILGLAGFLAAQKARYI